MTFQQKGNDLSVFEMPTSPESKIYEAYQRHTPSKAFTEQHIKTNKQAKNESCQSHSAVNIEFSYSPIRRDRKPCFPGVEALDVLLLIANKNINKSPHFSGIKYIVSTMFLRVHNTANVCQQITHFIIDLPNKLTSILLPFCFRLNYSNTCENIMLVIVKQQ